ncbi:MAG: hypothetical protein ACOXZ2_07990 [Sphaerochaetaceae bacterium]|nr:hypothetical protein [Sphaerochaetaceae bacterium]HHU89338.1 hypothetical protein [Spirochaetales bacterium]
MRKSVLSLFLLLIFISPLSAKQESFEEIARFIDLRTLAMGGAGVALADTPASLYRNPATLYHHEQPMFLVEGRFSEKVGSSADVNDFAPFLQNPSTTLGMLLSNRYIALSIALSNVLENRSLQGDALYFEGYNDSRIQLTLSYGWPIFSFGLFVRGGNRSERGVVLREGHTLTDYFRETIFERYRGGSADGQLFSAGFGLLLTYRWISIGIMSDSLFSYDSSSNELSLDLLNLYSGLTLGLALSSPIYNRDNELNRVVFNFAFDLTNLGDNEERSINMGLEGKVQFLSNVWLALRGGYLENMGGEGSPFAFDGQGVVTMGLGGQLWKVHLDVIALYSLKTDVWRLQTALKWSL